MQSVVSSRNLQAYIMLIKNGVKTFNVYTVCRVQIHKCSGHPGDREGWQGAAPGQGHEDPQGLQGGGTSVNSDRVKIILRAR